MAPVPSETTFDEGLTFNIDFVLSDFDMPMPGNLSLDVMCDQDLSCCDVSAADGFVVDFKNWMDSESDTPFLDSIVVL